MELRKQFLGGLYSKELIFGGLIFGGHFVLVSDYQDLKIHCYTGCPKKNDPTLQCHISKNIEFDVIFAYMFCPPKTATKMFVALVR